MQSVPHTQEGKTLVSECALESQIVRLCLIVPWSLRLYIRVSDCSLSDG